MTLTVEILNHHALMLLRQLEQMKAIRLVPYRGNGKVSVAPKKEFKAIRLDTRGFKFNREEANER